MKLVKISKTPILSATKKVSKSKCFEWFEKYLFGDQFEKPEKNTKDEDRIWKILLNFVAGRWTQTKKPKEVIDCFNKLRQCQPFYKDLLTPPKKSMYRGFMLPIKNAKILLKKTPKKLIKSKLAPKEGLYVFDYTYNPTYSIQSWTTSKKVASLFAVGEEGFIGTEIMNLEDFQYRGVGIRRILPVIVGVKPDNSFFMNPRLTNKLYRGKRVENEIIRLGESIEVELLTPKKEFREAKTIKV